jgi:PAS domain S-box-containing protein
MRCLFPKWIITCPKILFNCLKTTMSSKPRVSVRRAQARIRMLRMNRPAVVGIATLLCGLLLAGAAGLWQKQYNETEATEKFHALSERVVSEVTERMQRYEFGLLGARGAAIAADSRITRDAFKRYSTSRDIDREFPGARGFGIIWRVAQSDEAAFVGAARADGWPDFSIRQLEPHSGERFVIQYIEPVGRNRQAVGLDIASERNRREAALAAAQSGQATLTGPITLVQATSKPVRSFLLLLPIYRQGAVLTSRAEREAAVIAWSYAPLVIDEILGRLGNEAGQYTLALRDTLAADSSTFYQSSARQPLPAAGLRHQKAFEIFGRTWELTLQATPDFVHGLAQTSQTRVMAISAAIAALCAVLAALLAQLALSKYLEQNARDKRNEQARRAAIVESSEDAIFGVLLDGTITDWNVGAERLLGYAAPEVLGRNIVELLVPPSLAAEEANIANMASRGARQPPFETQRLHRSGELIDVSVSAAPIMNSDGRCVGYSKSLRDIRESKRVQSALQRTNERFSLAADSAGIGVWEYDLVTNMLAWDNRMFTLYGRKQQDNEAPYTLWSQNLHPEDREASETILHAAIAGTAVFDTAFRIIHPNGDVRTLKANATVERDATGQALRMLGINYDITVAQEAEKRQAAFVEQLSRVNDELNSFAYIASHDLKSPLRGIDQLANWITEDLGDTLSNGTLEHLRLMQSRIKRMEMLLDDLLAYLSHPG